ncbi:acetyltransferase [Rhizobium sp. Root1203]|uniref:GNAT family N-acetyltransferase n=1 Tax=Rhizobium sp. Root1203 TaxID=1736427 RepID=UPI00070AFFEF|nr:GNAT family N-acetyltransferase [Rhizobium sp. Root1203]KQV27812.1 acetyltransferase [Rhizobium sp. Root1203]
MAKDTKGETIRMLGADDVEAFRRIRLEALRAEPSAYASSLEDWEGLSKDEWTRRLLDARVFVAFQQDDPVAIMGMITQAASKMSHRATVVMVYVRETMRGTGLAMRVLDRLVTHACDCGIRQLELAVSIENAAAKQFYARAGFVEAGLIPSALLHRGREIDEFIMVRRIAH